MIGTAMQLENLTLSINEEVRVRASLETTFAALLEQLGPGNERGDGTAMPMKLEARPGGRWFRDLGGEDGHFWGVVQAIKRPTLLEITGPLFMSYPAISNVQYRLSEANGRDAYRVPSSGAGIDCRRSSKGSEHRMGAHQRKRAEACRGSGGTKSGSMNGPE